MNDVPVFGEAPEHVSDALLQRVQLRLDQHFSHQMFSRKLNQALSWEIKKNFILLTLVEK